MNRLFSSLLMSVALWAQFMAPAHALLAMRISNLSDITVTGWSIGDSAINRSMDICVHTAGVTPIGGYQIKVSSPSGYVLTSGVNQLPYELYWDDGGAGNLGSGLGTQLTNNVTLSGRLRGNILDNGCVLTGPNARLNFRVTQPSMTAAKAGTYTGTITLLLTPA